MQRRLRERTASNRSPSSFRGAVRNVSTPQGKYTMYALVLCAVLGMVLTKVLPPIVRQLNNTATQQEVVELSIAIALGISAVILVVTLLKMRVIVAKINKRRSDALYKSLGIKRDSDEPDA